MTLLFEKNLAQINSKNIEGGTALMMASRYGHTDIVKKLLNKEAKTDLQDNNDWTALILASRNGHTAVVKELLAKEAKTDLQNKDGWTALMMTSELGYKEIVKKLLIHHASPNLQNKGGVTALMVASRYRHPEIVKELLAKEANTDLQDTNGWTALMAASELGYTEVVKELLTHNAHPNLQDKNGWTALMMASRYGHPEIVKELLTKEANSDLQNNEGWTAVMLALRENRPDIIELLLEKDAPLKTGLQYYWHDIMPVDISYCKHNDVLATSHFNSFFLVENAGDYPWKSLSQEQIETFKTAKIFFKHEKHWTTPCLATMILPWYQEQVSLIRIKETADIQTPLTIYCIEYKGHYFRLTGEAFLLHYLRQSASCKLTTSTVLDYLRFFSFFVRKEHRAFNIIDPDIPHWQKNLILPKNQSLSSPKITRIDEQENYYCDATVNYAFQLFQGKFCIYNDGVLKMLTDPYLLKEALCRSEDEMLVCSNFIFTPLIAACKEGYKEVVRQLICEDVDMSVIDHEGKTALSYAQEAGHTEIVEMLLAAGAKKGLDKET